MFGKTENLLGISMEHNRLSLTQLGGGQVSRTLYVDIPDNVTEHGEILSKNLFAALLKDTLKENRISAKKVAFVVPADDVFIRNLTIPQMSEEQIKYNIPFEFRDYIRGELKEYTFDYAYRPPLAGEEDAPTLNLLAVAISKEKIADFQEVMGLAGLRLVKAVPVICTYEELLKQLPDPEEVKKERCFLDIGVSTSRMLIFKNGRYKLMHTVDIGERKLVQTIADEMNVDMHIAKTYMTTNYQDCWQLPAVMNNYRDISIEVLKGLNFYEVSDMTARLKDIVLTGGGSLIKPLADILKERITMNVVTMGELFPQLDPQGILAITAPTVGILLQD